MDGTHWTPVDESDMWMNCCDICIEVATDPVTTTCGHLFCRSCLNEVFQAQSCPLCGADFREETTESIPIDRIETPAGPTPEAADSEIPTPMTARSRLITIARLDVVQDYLEEEIGHIHNIQLNLIRHVSTLRGDRIRELEQVVQNLMQMNLTVLRVMEDCMHDRNRMRRRIEELENPTVHGDSAFARRQRRVGRRITPTPIAAGNDEAAPESVEGRLFTTN